MKPRFLFWLALLAVLLTACAAQPEPVFTQNGIEIYSPSLYAARAGEVTGAFMTIKNATGQADWLVGASCDAAQAAEIHESVVENGVASMRPVESIAIPDGKMVELRHGSYHIMLINLNRDLKDGETVTVTLKFSQAGEIDLPLVVSGR